mmetsp:Transcript_84186/g.243082  ORF Transcript_84186/g.243082 Transcript_84186/m.243082 type:complete len:109 (+) Transcript_84186:49-375(+)
MLLTIIMTLCGLCTSSVTGATEFPGVVGDPVPPQYPTVELHIPEPLQSAYQSTWRAADEKHKEEQLDFVRGKLRAQRASLLGSVDTLTTQLEGLEHEVEIMQPSTRRL